MLYNVLIKHDEVRTWLLSFKLTSVQVLHMHMIQLIVGTNKQSRAKRVCVGKVDPQTGKIVPTRGRAKKGE